jgi:hypothetical protein
MCCLPMVINADGIKLNGVAPSVWSVWYSFLAMIQLPRYSCAPARYDTSNHVCAGPFGRTAPIGYVETDRDSRNPRCGGRRHIVSDLLGTERWFDTHRRAVQVASTHRCFPSKMAKRIVGTTDFVQINNVSSEITRVGIMSAHRRTPHN